jgi:DNA-binding HxlR family transcriptional regulator
MAAAKVRVSRHTAPHTLDCPMSDPAVESQFGVSMKASKEFSQAVLGFLADRPSDAQARWAQASVEAGRVLFQPWSMEILFVLAVSRKARFTQLQTLLGGISSRTLSDKLQTLRSEGLIERDVHDEQPVRIEYALTSEGRRTAALATPLFAHLNHRKM